MNNPSLLTRLPDFSGFWRIELPRNGGVRVRTYFIIAQNETSCSGTVVINDAVNVRIDSSDLTFDIEWQIAYRMRHRHDSLQVRIAYRD